MIDDLLAFAQLRRSGLSKAPVALAEVAGAAWSELEPLHAEAGAELVIKELPAVTADPRLLRQVFVNLLSNAVKFSRPAQTEHPARITIEATSTPKAAASR